MVTLAAVLVMVALLWWVGIAPALQTLRQFDASNRQLELQVQQMQSLQQQAHALQGNASAISPSAARRSLDTATPKLLGASAQVTLVGDRVTVRFKDVEAAALAQWLAQMRESAKALPVQTELERSKVDTALRWSGSVTLALQTAEGS